METYPRIYIVHRTGSGVGFPSKLETKKLLRIVKFYMNNYTANILILLVLRHYIGAANQLAPIYWRCKHLKNPRNF
jgi:hypothetical protein